MAKLTTEINIIDMLINNIGRWNLHGYILLRFNILLCFNNSFLLLGKALYSCSASIHPGV